MTDVQLRYSHRVHRNRHRVLSAPQHGELRKGVTFGGLSRQDVFDERGREKPDIVRRTNPHVTIVTVARWERLPNAEAVGTEEGDDEERRERVAPHQYESLLINTNHFLI